MGKLLCLKRHKEEKEKVPFPSQNVQNLLENMENSMMSESSLKKDWLSPEEKEAWKDL